MKSMIAVRFFQWVPSQRAAAGLFKSGCGLLLSGCCLFLTGCGTGGYDALMASRLTELNHAAPFTVLYEKPLVLEGTRVQIRVPQLFRLSYKKDSPHPFDGAAISPQRVVPPFMNLPGFSLCFETIDSDPQNFKVPYYCYLAALPMRPGLTLEAQIAGKLKQVFPAADPVWEPVAVANSTGVDVPGWKTIRVEGEQNFDAQKPGQPQPEPMNMPGIFELWMNESADYIVLVGWRISASLEDKVHLLELAPITAGTLFIAPAPAEAPADAGAAAAQPPA